LQLVALLCTIQPQPQHRVRFDLQDCGLVAQPSTVTQRSVRVARLRPVPVMLAAPIPALPGRDGGFRRLSAEPKYDGYRLLLLRYDGRCVVQSRRGTDLSGSFPDLVAAALEQVPEETILDGEVVVGVDGRLDWP
jgi:ATP-dependent DNA ligase